MEERIPSEPEIVVGLDIGTTKIATIIGYKNESGDSYSFKPDETISRGEFIKMAISLANNRGFDYSIFPLPLLRSLSSTYFTKNSPISFPFSLDCL